MNEIRLTGNKTFMGKEIPVIEGGFGEHCKAILAKTIADIHELEVKRINELINNNRKRFKDDIDIIDLMGENFKDVVNVLEIKKGNRTKNIYLLSERGYAKLIKIMDSDKAWDIHDELIDEYFSMREQLKTIAIQSPQAFVDSLKLTKYSIEHYLPNFLTWKNVDEVIPRLIERVSDSVDKGEIKIEVLTAIKNVAEAVYDACPGSAEKEIMARHIRELRNKYDRVLIASNAANTKVKNDSKAKVEELEKEVKRAETKRLCDFSEKALKRAYNEAGIIQDIVNKEVNKQIEDDLKESFKANLYSNVKLIVENSNLDWDQAYNAVYRAMGILRHPKGYKHVVDYIWDQGKEWDCIAAAVKVREYYGC